LSEFTSVPPILELIYYHSFSTERWKSGLKAYNVFGIEVKKYLE